jgi:hypothetical protein
MSVAGKFAPWQSVQRDPHFVARCTRKFVLYFVRLSSDLDEIRYRNCLRLLAIDLFENSEEKAGVLMWLDMCVSLMLSDVWQPTNMYRNVGRQTLAH